MEFELNANIYSSSRYDEGFAGPDYENFHLTTSSGAINGGVLTDLDWDIEDGYRNLAGAPDIGAYEYVPLPIPYFESIDLVGLYVDDFKNILGDDVAETELLEFAQDEGFNYLLLYNLAYIHSHDYDLTDPEEAIVLADFIERAKRDYGIVQVGAVGEKDASFDKIETFNALFGDNWFQKFDVLNLEFEFWANEDSDVFEYYCDTYLAPGGYACTNEGAFDFYVDQLELIDERSHEMGIFSEIYLGKITEPQGIELGENCDRILLHYYRTSDVYGDGSSIYNYNSDRIKYIALSDRKPAIMPIFSNREYHMGPWLLLNDMDQVMETWLNGVDAYVDDFAPGVQDLNIAGHQWYRYTSFPDVEVGFYAPIEADELREISETGISMYANVQSKNLVITDVSEGIDDGKILQLYSIHGELLSAHNIQQGTNMIEMDDLAPGLYICNLISEGRVIETTKVVYQ